MSPSSAVTVQRFTNATITVLGLVDKMKGFAEPFVPFLSQAFAICTVINDTLEQLKSLRVICQLLADRITHANSTLSNAARSYADLPGKFMTDDFADAFETYIATLIKVQGYVIKISHKTTLSRILRGNDYIKHFENLILQLDDAARNLALAISICLMGKSDIMIQMTQQNNEDIVRLIVSEFKEFQNHVDNGLEKISETVKFAIKSPDENLVEILTSKAVIDPSDLKDVDDENKKFYREDVKMYRGSLVTRKLYNSRNKKDVEKIRREVFLMWSVSNCPYVQHVYGMFEKDQNLTVLWEYAELGNLHELMEEDASEKKNIPWSDRWNMSFDIAQGISFLHACQIFHHDIRSENIVVTDRMQAKITNFSVSRLQYKESLGRDTDDKLYLRWVAPERLYVNSRPKEKVLYTYACDIYSLGMLFWEIAEWTGKYPYADIKGDINDIIKFILQGDQSRPSISMHIPRAFRDIIIRAWKQDPNERPESAAEISRMLLVARDEIKYFSEDTNIQTPIS